MAKLRFQLRWTSILLGLTILVAATIAGGIVQGMLQQRWGPGTEVEQIAAKLASVPEKFGPWELRHESTFGEESLRQLQPHEYLSATYANRFTNQYVTVFVLMGPVGPTAVHTPEICMGSQDYSRVTEREAITIGSPADSEEESDALWRVVFESDSLQGAGTNRMVYYGWSTGGPWLPADDPRYEFRDLPYLYKIQAFTDIPTIGTEEGEEDPIQRFMRDFLPVLREHMVDARK